MPKEDKKKARKRVEIDGNTGEQVFDSESFGQAFEAWKKECGAAGDTLRMKTSSASLLDLVSQHGSYHRKQTKDPVDMGAGEIVERLGKIVDDAEILETEDGKFIIEAIRDLKEVEKKNNPRNIKYTIPKWNRVDKKTLEYDKNTDVTEVFGHYRTPDYIKFRNLKAKRRGNVDKETMAAAPAAWFDTKPGKSKPPMWQALFATGDGDIVKHGLLSVLTQAKGLITGGQVKIQNLVLRVRDTGKGTTAADLWEIKAVRDWLKEQVGSKTSPNSEGISPARMFRDDKMTRALSRTPFTDISVRESKIVKEVAGYEDLIGTVEDFKIIITRRQMRNLAVIAGKEDSTLGLKRTPGKETVFMEGGDDKKTSYNVEPRDWRTILKREW